MNIKPVASPHQVMSSNENPQAQADARSRAIAKLSPPAPTQMPVQNSNQVAPEELSAIMPQEQQAEGGEVTETTEESQEVQEQAESKKLENEYQILARKERQMRARQQRMEQEISSKEEALQAKIQELERRESEVRSGYISKDRLKKSPLTVLQEEGVTYDDLTQQILNSSPIDPRMEALINKQSEQLEALQAKLSAYEDNTKTAAEQQKAAALKQIRRDAEVLVKQAPGDFELVQATNSFQDVVDLIDKTYEEEGFVMSVEEALTEVESYLLEETDKLTRLEKIKRRLNPKPEQDIADKQTPQTKQTQPMKTLTNANSSTKQLSNRERAIAAFERRLK